MDSLYHWDTHDVRAPTIQVQPTERWTDGVGESQIFTEGLVAQEPRHGGFKLPLARRAQCPWLGSCFGEELD